MKNLNLTLISFLISSPTLQSAMLVVSNKIFIYRFIFSSQLRFLIVVSRSYRVDPRIFGRPVVQYIKLTSEVHKSLE
jgi:hypothetical protein